MCLSFMGIFNVYVPILTIGSSLGIVSSLLSSIPFYVLHLEYPWSLTSTSTSDEYPQPTKMDMSLSTMTISYQATLSPIVDPSPSSFWTEEEDPYTLPAWAVASSHSHDCLNYNFPSDEAILEAMNGLDGPWKELHH